MRTSASDAKQVRWAAHPIASRVVRVLIFVVPFLTAMVSAYGLSTMIPLASSMPVQILRWLVIVSLATIAMRIVDRFARRLLPLSTLLELTLVFPDQAPSRFSVAMRTGTTKHLAKRIEAARTGRDGETPAEAAERLLELVGLLSHHDRLTRGHSERVRAYTHVLGTELGLTTTELDKIRWAGLLHDVGKIEIDTAILNKPGKLTDEEYEAIKAHPEAGRGLVAPLESWLGDSLRAVWEHHEKFDGTGYPRGLSGTDISMAARIVAVADVYDVMTSARSYKAPMPADEARAELARCSGTHFDPVVVRAFLNISLGRLRLMAGPLAWLAQFSLFEPTGVVHAGSSSGAVGGGATGGAASAAGAATGTATGSVAAGAAGAAAATGGASFATVVSSAAAVTLGVASGAVGVAASDPDPAPTVEAAVVEVVDVPATTIVVSSAPGDEADVSGGGATLVATMRSDRSDDPSPVTGDGAQSDPATSAAKRSTSDDATVAADATPAVTAPGQETSSSTPAVTAPGQETSSSTPAVTAPGQETSSSTPAVTAPGQETSSSTPAATAPGRSSTTTTTVPATTTTVPATTTTVPATSTTTTTTTTVPATTTTTTEPPFDPTSDKWFLDAPAGDTVALADYGLTSVRPDDRPLPNYDTDRDGAPGLLVQKDEAGPAGTDPAKVAVFSMQTLVSLDLDHEVELHLRVAAKDFERDDIRIAAELRHCTLLGGCVVIGSGEKEAKNADRWKTVNVDLGEIDRTIGIGDRFELRVAVLDDSENDAWLAFGTKDDHGWIALDDD